MGSSGNGLLLGARVGKAPKKLGDEGWNELAMQYAKETGGEQPETPWGDKCLGKFLGFYVALGNEQEQPGVPPMDEPLRLAGVGNDVDSLEAAGWPAPIHRRYLAASKAWVAFAAWAEKKGHRFDAPFLWIVQTEIA